ncbi:MAG TPA: response regulator transcription factor, partial [Candidatus Melainabacteria bacterium]|nr:response regulator transcription factor [Candidatus Melainabacteria bacterium]
MAKVLLVEDDETLSAMIIDWLQNERFLVDAVANGNEGMSLLKVNQYDAIILDWNLPGMSGVDICRAYRGAGGRAPVIMLTAKAMISDKAQGFDSGADDYLTKPFDVRELAMRVHALLRRPATMPSNVLRAKNGLELDPQKHRVTKNGEEVHLLPRDFELLQL